MEAVSREAVRFCKAIGMEGVTRVEPSVGAEQEYFIVDRAAYEERLDLKICGTTLMGAPMPKGQELGDHYLGRIRLRISKFMEEADRRLWELGVPSKTKHNEVAPAQHELAPVYESCNVACDHNQLVMETLREVAKEQGLACLLHEKPFARVNGSGKHDNYSLCTDTGVNLLSPGKDPAGNPRFLLTLCAFLRGIDSYPELLRLSAATPGNDCRLGGNEAPPSIISVFLGDALLDTLRQAAGEEIAESHGGRSLSIGVSTSPELMADDSDRNRTSPFAFTGNKFEFRMPGSHENLSDANTILNTAVAKELKGYADELEGAEDFTSAVIALVKRTIRDHRRVIFNGDGYSAEWEIEAERRGLPNKKYTPAALPALIAPKNIQLMEEFGVMTRTEMFSRYEVEMEHYAKIINIEALTMLEMARKQLLPAINAYMGQLAATINAKRAVSQSLSTRSETSTLEQLSKDADAMSDAVAHLAAAERTAQSLTDMTKKANAFHDSVLPAMDVLRAAADNAETICGEEYWPLPSYSQMLYYVEG